LKLISYNVWYRKDLFTKYISTHLDLCTYILYIRMYRVCIVRLEHFWLHSFMLFMRLKWFRSEMDLTLLQSKMCPLILSRYPCQFEYSYDGPFCCKTFWQKNGWIFPSSLSLPFGVGDVYYIHTYMHTSRPKEGCSVAAVQCDLWIYCWELPATMRIMHEQAKKWAWWIGKTFPSQICLKSENKQVPNWFKTHSNH